PPTPISSTPSSTGTTPTSSSVPTRTAVPIAAAPPRQTLPITSSGSNNVNVTPTTASGTPSRLIPGRPRCLDKSSVSGMYANVRNPPEQDLLGRQRVTQPPPQQPRQPPAAFNPAHHSLAAGATRTNSQEWEWLTMSL
ncbi:hypothetical protein H101_07990, partial [Trichophyton interdigitale H6]